MIRSHYMWLVLRMISVVRRAISLAESCLLIGLALSHHRVTQRVHSARISSAEGHHDLSHDVSEYIW